MCLADPGLGENGFKVSLSSLPQHPKKKWYPRYEHVEIVLPISRLKLWGLGKAI